MFTCSIISCSNDNSHFFRILFRVSEYWTPASMQSARRSEKLENRKILLRCPLTTLTLLVRYFSSSLHFALRNRRAVNRLKRKALGPFKVTLERFWILLQEKKGEKFTNKFTNEPLKSASKP